MENRETITISIRRFEELIYKEAAYEMKRQELVKADFVSTLDSVLFQCPEEPEDTGLAKCADADF